MALPASPEFTVRVGDIIADKYRVDALLGSGGMGAVAAVTHTQLNKKFAIKFLLSKAQGDPKAVERFHREAQAAVRIKSEHVARVFDIGRLDTGAAYILMEFLQGNDLAQELKKRSVLPLCEAVDYVLQACEVLSEAHALGIIHRDLKPSNLFLVQRADGSRQVKVLDFGISKLMSSGAEAALTTTTTIIGSPRYMSPEQIRYPKQVDPRTDVWALGVTLYELIGGQLPFVAEETGELLAAIIADEPKGIRELNSGLPFAVEALLNKCLAKDRSQRVANIAELALALRSYASDTGKISADRAASIGTSFLWESGDPSSISAQTGFGSAVTRNPITRSVQPILPWLGASMIVVLAVAVGIFWYVSAPAGSIGVPQASSELQSGSMERPIHSTYVATQPAQVEPKKSVPEPEPAAAAVIEQRPHATKYEPATAPTNAPSNTKTPAAYFTHDDQPFRSRVVKPLPTSIVDGNPALAPDTSDTRKPDPARSVDPLSGRK